MTDPTRQQLQHDVDLIGQIDAIPTILDVICRSTGMGFAAVARVTERHWIACRVLDKVDFGLVPGGELQIDTTICDEIRDSGKLVVFDNASIDPVFRDHHTPRIYGLQSYISVPIYRGNAEFFGTLCAIDARPAVINTPQTIGMFQLFAELIGKHIDAREREQAKESQLQLEREMAVLREQFVAILGHDLRTPLSSIAVGTQLLKHGVAPERQPTIARMERSVRRMEMLIDNMLDFSRARLGAGFDLQWQAEPALADHLRQVIAELSAAWPDRRIVTDIALDGAVPCDSARLCQMLSNLLSNALTHGDPDSAVQCTVRGDAQHFRMEVRNAGTAIAPDVMARLFEPFCRGTDGNGRHSQGLGLGLYIAAEIAKAHGGTLRASSDAVATSFVFDMPAAP